MSLREQIDNKKQYAGKFSLRRFEALLTSGKALFSDEKVALTNGIYTLKSEKVTTGTIFQLLVSQTTANTYLYAIGIEPNGQLKTYWPKANESALLPFSEIDLFIPGSDGGLQFQQQGMEQVIILFATQPIPNLRLF